MSSEQLPLFFKALKDNVTHKILNLVNQLPGSQMGVRCSMFTDKLLGSEKLVLLGTYNIVASVGYTFEGRGRDVDPVPDVDSGG